MCIRDRCRERRRTTAGSHEAFKCRKQSRISLKHILFEIILINAHIHTIILVMVNCKSDFVCDVVFNASVFGARGGGF